MVKFLKWCCFPFLGGHLEKEAKNIANHLLHFKHDLDVVAEYSQRPLPLIAEQALHLVFWATLVVGTLDNNHQFLDLDTSKLSFVILVSHVNKTENMVLDLPKNWLFIEDSQLLQYNYETCLK